ncbi:hypothetical protein [Providencia hangzhouensis]
MTIKTKYQYWIKRLEENGVQLIPYSCPHCAETIKTSTPAKGEKAWDSLAVCPFCERPFMKYVTRKYAKAFKINCH